jgi:hypothetical protein
MEKITVELLQLSWERKREFYIENLLNKQFQCARGDHTVDPLSMKYTLGEALTRVPGATALRFNVTWPDPNKKNGVGDTTIGFNELISSIISHSWVLTRKSHINLSKYLSQK